MAPALDVFDDTRETPLADTNSVHGLSETSARHISLWQDKVRGGFAAFPVVFASAQGHTITDVDGKTYIDMISQFAVMNFGHSHPKIVEATVKELRNLHLVNTSYINPLYAQYADRMTKKFGFDSICAMLSGGEAVDAAIKIARKWAYVNKGVATDDAWVLTTDRCYHGITLSTMALSNVKASRFGCHLPNVGPFSPVSQTLVRFGDIDTLEQAFKEAGDRIAAFLIEPVQGFAGTISPEEGYLSAVQSLCRKYNVLFICDEIQTGYGRTGTDLAYQYEPGVQPDMVILGKAITGGVFPLSIVMGKKRVMDVLDKAEVANTYAASPPACAAALAALDVLEDEKISERAQKLGRAMTQAIDNARLPYMLEHRGRTRGLFQTLVVDESVDGVSARRIASLCALRRVLCGSSENRLRFSPPLTISEVDLIKAVEVLSGAFRDVAGLGEFPGSEYIN